MRIPAGRIKNTPKATNRGTGKAHYNFYVDDSGDAPKVGDTVEWVGGDCTVTQVDHQTASGTWVRAER